jgi:predicted DCC family thiol-disulfide oxidoreductase YuxK
MTISYPLTIYYDASCPLCRTEISALKQYDANGRIEIIDCSPDNFKDEHADKAGYGREAMMRLIHARDAAGQWLIGVPVFEAAYGATGIVGMQKLWGNSMLRPIWDRIYPWVADNRMFLSKLGVTKLFGWMVTRAAKKANATSQACKDGVCEIPSRD